MRGQQQRETSLVHYNRIVLDLPEEDKYDPSSNLPQHRGGCSSAERRFQAWAPVPELYGPKIQKHVHNTDQPFRRRNSSIGSNLRTSHRSGHPDPSRCRTSDRGSIAEESCTARSYRGRQLEAGCCYSSPEAPDPVHCAMLSTLCLFLLLHLRNRKCRPPVA